MSIDDHIATVNALVRSYVRAGETNPSAAATAMKLRALVDFLAEEKRLSAPMAKSLGDISDLPDELIRELSVQKTDELEDQILRVMRACQGEANLDQVLVGLYRSFKVVQTRRFIQNKLYRMSKKDLVYQVPGQRAAYSLEPPPPAPPQLNGGGYDDDGGYGSAAPARGLPSADLDDEIPF